MVVEINNVTAKAEDEFIDGVDFERNTRMADAP